MKGASVLWAWAWVVTALWQGQAAAQGALRISAAKPGQIRVDGALDEWRGARFGRLAGADAAAGELRYALAFDAEALYLAARVRDDERVLVSAPSRAQDALVLTLVAPRAGGGSEVSELWLFAGVPGKQASQAALARGASGALEPVRGATLIEAELDEPAGARGYVLEAKLPWALLAGGDALFLGRGALRLHDIDGGKLNALSTASGAPSRLPELLFDGGPSAALADLLRQKGLPPGEMRFESYGHVSDDARLERVVVAGTHLLIASASAKGAFRYLDLPVALGADVLGVALDDQDGDGRAEIVVRMREGGGELTRAYRFDGSRFAVHSEHRTPDPNAPSVAPDPASDTPPSKPSAREQTPVAEHSVVHTKPPGMDDLVAAYREARGVSASVRARFVTHVNVAEDPRIESLLVLDRALLVVGRGFQGGTGYFFYELPVASGDDVLRMFTADVTGDGRREVFFRIRQRVGDVQREVLLAYAFTNEGFQPILANEVRRALGEQSVGNVVRLMRAGKYWALRVEPGHAVGFTADSYPFSSEPADAFGVPLLPWLHSPVQYRWDGQRLVP